MSESQTYRGTYRGMIVEVQVPTHPTPTQLQKWKDLWTWLLTPPHVPEEPCDPDAT